MAYSRRGSLFVGLVLFFSFFGVLILIFSPIFSSKNGLDYADELFNKLTKGSSYFIPGLFTSTEKFTGKTFRTTLSLEKVQEAEQTAKLFSLGGAKVEVQGGTLSIEGDLGKLLQSILRDSDHMFKNDGQKVTDRYGCDGKEALHCWWMALGRMEKSFKKNLQIEESRIVSEVIKRGIEPAYNFYQVEQQKVADRAGIMIFLLVFYIVYTLWWGYAIFHLFEGFGLSMKKAKVKKEN
ncbi:MAG TPA: hypothetical protein VEH09_05065 [Thermodesulfobacteriota bacterium]|nr:hypothetical protein [Thermodesulfobacteriota bacterium]